MEQHESKTDTGWLRRAGLRDQERYQLRRSVNCLTEPLGTSRSEVSLRVNVHDLYRFQQLIVDLGLDRHDPQHRRMFRALLNAGRKIAHLRPEDIKDEIQHQAYLVERAADRDEELRETRGALFEVMARMRKQRDRIGSRLTGAADSSAAQAASDRLDQDIDWAHDQLRQLR
ncbi:MAG: hypothetical protein ACE37H_08020 [Phycisphaeraceae bacterium]